MDGNGGAWSGWIAFAGLLMIVIGSLDFFAGLVAIINDRYYTVTRDQMVLIHDVSHWGWVTLIWGIIIVLAGFGLLAGSGWARWFTIVVGVITFFVNLGWLGNTAYPLWTLTVLVLQGVVLYALMVHWSDATEGMART
ncbi:MAG TPA: hypothetical protein VLU96_12665 [Gaiellaceae bacterium]|nr:hypothetical protein [Gaiellaceae bacterium]